MDNFDPSFDPKEDEAAMREAGRKILARRKAAAKKRLDG